MEMWFKVIGQHVYEPSAVTSEDECESSVSLNAAASRSPGPPRLNAS